MLHERTLKHEKDIFYQIYMQMEHRFLILCNKIHEQRTYRKPQAIHQRKLAGFNFVWLKISNIIESQIELKLK